MLRHILFPFEALTVGPVYARHKFLGRCDKPQDSKKIWKLIACPRDSLKKWFEDSYPLRSSIAFGTFFYHHTRNFKLPNLGISRHYDISNELYKLFLDKKYMFYSSGDFKKKTDTLEDAQENKANYLLDLIDPKPGEKILDIGCGWGAMMKKIVNKTKDKDNIVGYSISGEQMKYIKDELGYRIEDRDMITTDYSVFDKIYTIEIIEHVRIKDLVPFAKKLAASIKPRKGKIIHQFFSQKDRYPHPVLLPAIDIFPGSELAPMKTHLDAFKKADLKVSHHSVHDYRPTLKAWFDRLAENKDEATELIGARNYNRYLSYLAVAWRLFNEHHLMLNRFVLENN